MQEKWFHPKISNQSIKLLLDENIPRPLRKDFSDFDVFTVQDMGWQGKENGELLKLMLENDFDALITVDKNLQSQQNFKMYPIPVLVLNVQRLTYGNILLLLPELTRTLQSDLNPGPVVINQL